MVYDLFLSLTANYYFIKYVIVINYIYHDIISKWKYNMFKMKIYFFYCNYWQLTMLRVT